MTLQGLQRVQPGPIMELYENRWDRRRVQRKRRSKEVVLGSVNKRDKKNVFPRPQVSAVVILYSLRLLAHLLTAKGL